MQTALHTRNKSSFIKTLTSDNTTNTARNYQVFGDSSLRTFTYKRYRYVGKEKDSESGLYYYGARYYAAWTCRFISVDPLAAKYAHLTPYNYAGNKPIGDYDIDGMQSTGDTTTPITAGGGDATFNDTAKQVAETYGGKEGYTVTIKTHMIDGKFTGEITVTGDGKTVTGKYEDGKFTYSGGEQDKSTNMLGTSIKSVYNSELRAGYLKNIGSNADNNLKLLEKAVTPAEQEAVVNKAINDRNTSKMDVRKKLTTDAAEITKHLEQDAKYTEQNLRKMYSPGGEKGKSLTGKALNEEIVRASGRSNPLLSKWNGAFRKLGWVGLGVGLTLSTVRIYQDPTATTIGDEVGATAGGFAGSVVGSALLVSGAVALGIVTGGVGLLVIGLIGGIAGGWAGSEIGGWAGRGVGQKIKD